MFINEVNKKKKILNKEKMKKRHKAHTHDIHNDHYHHM